MIAIAETLGGDFEFARIDLYDHDGRIYFGEITHYPNGRTEIFDPPASTGPWAMCGGTARPFRTSSSTGTDGRSDAARAGAQVRRDWTAMTRSQRLRRSSRWG
jgi:hypothetical protein